jgi:hypothetical protein
MLISTYLIVLSVIVYVKLPCRRVEVGYEKLLENYELLVPKNLKIVILLYIPNGCQLKKINEFMSDFLCDPLEDKK